MRTGDMPPRCSCTLGPVGTTGAAGAAPRPGTVTAQTSEPPMPTQRARRRQHRVEIGARHRRGPAGGRLADPQLDAGAGRLREREAGAVRREADPGQRRRGRQRHRPDGAVGHGFQRQRSGGADAMAAVGGRVDAQPGQPQHRPRQLGDGRHRRVLEHGDDVAGRAEHHLGRPGLIEDVDDRLGRQQVGLIGRGAWAALAVARPQTTSANDTARAQRMAGSLRDGRDTTSRRTPIVALDLRSTDRSPDRKIARSIDRSRDRRDHQMRASSF